MQKHKKVQEEPRSQCNWSLERKEELGEPTTVGGPQIPLAGGWEQ